MQAGPRQSDKPRHMSATTQVGKVDLIVGSQRANDAEDEECEDERVELRGLLAARLVPEKG